MAAILSRPQCVNVSIFCFQVGDLLVPEPQPCSQIFISSLQSSAHHSPQKPLQWRHMSVMAQCPKSSTIRLLFNSFFRLTAKKPSEFHIVLRKRNPPVNIGTNLTKGSVLMWKPFPYHAVSWLWKDVTVIGTNSTFVSYILDNKHILGNDS